MRDFIIVTDSTVDLPESMLEVAGNSGAPVKLCIRWQDL